MKILLVEDDIDLNETIKEFLEDKYEIISVFNGEDAINKAYEEDIDLIILDVKLPDNNGFEVAKEIRNFKDIPIIFLTSLNTQKDIEKGFLSGGDDYITKPFSLKELLFRIEAILRRIYKSEIIKIDENISFNVNNLVLIKDNEKIHLKPKLAKLLKLLLKKRGQIVSKDEIINEIYSFDEIPNFNSIKTFINNLRNLIGKDKIETIKNVGYRFVS